VIEVSAPTLEIGLEGADDGHMIRRDWKLDQLSTIDVLSNVPKRRLREIVSLTTVLRLPAGKVLWEQGERATEAYMVLEGELGLTWNGEPLEVVRPGAVVGGIGLAESAPRITTSTTLTEVYALVMSRAEYRHLLRLCPEVAGRVEAGHQRRFASRRVTAAA
jgi:CRP-like cAMP-binding protein